MKRPPSFDKNDVVGTPTVAMNGMPIAFICLADGHAGFETAAFVSKNLHTYVRDAIESETTLPMMSKKKNSSSPSFFIAQSSGKESEDDENFAFSERDREICEVALERSLERCEQELRDNEADNGSGACLAAMILSPSSLHVAHIGDCRVVALWDCSSSDSLVASVSSLVAEQLTCDHKASVRCIRALCSSVIFERDAREYYFYHSPTQTNRITHTIERNNRAKQSNVTIKRKRRYPRNENVYFDAEEL